MSSTDILVRAVANGDLHAVDRLLRQGADVDVLAPSGLSALSIAIERRHPEIAERLLSAGADPNLGNPSALQTCSMYQVDAELLKKVLSAGADVEERGYEGRTALVEAASHGNVATVAVLLEHGANPNVETDVGETPLSFACVWCYPEVVRLLIAAGANVNHRDHRQNTPLHFATRFGCEEAEQLLLAAGADASAVNAWGMGVDSVRQARNHGHSDEGNAQD